MSLESEFRVWSNYAVAYDLMAENNPAYQEIVTSVLQRLLRHKFNAGDVIVDLGAGTGNTSVAVAKQHPECNIYHVEPNDSMRAIAQKKGNFLPNWHSDPSDAQSFNAADESLAAIISIHSLYVLPDPPSVIGRFGRMLRPGGIWYICDLGRVLNLFDWARFLFVVNSKRHGILATLRLFRDGYANILANRLIRQRQIDGTYWLHDLAELKRQVMKAGLEIIDASTSYRGYSDVVVCRKPIRLV